MENINALNGQEVEPEESQIEEAPSMEQDAPEDPTAEFASMESLLEEQGVSLDLPKQGEVRMGTIATVRDNEILVSIGTKSEGVLSGRELEHIPAEEREALKPGMEIPVFVVAPEDSSGNVVLSYTRAREEQDWVTVDALLENNDAYESKIIGYNKGGLIVPVGLLRGFVPASQISVLRRSGAEGENAEQRYSSMVGEVVSVRVIEVDRSRRRLILSERLALQETRESLKDRLLDELNEGDVRSGRVTSLANFGAFVNIDGADGLVHLSEISWDRIQHPNEVLEVGEEVNVKVISLDRDRKRIGLSIRQLQGDPWLKKVEHFKEGVLVEGTVTHLTKFGAFARIDDDLEGLIHVSELSEQRIGHPKEVVREGDVITLRVIKIDPERRRIGLSLRKVDSAAYTDLDWKMALAEEVGKANQEEEEPQGELAAAGVTVADVAEETAGEEQADEAEEMLEQEDEPQAEAEVAELHVEEPLEQEADPLEEAEAVQDEA